MLFRRDILENCYQIDKLAVITYQIFADKTSDENLKRFWNRMAGEEQEHLEYWTTLLELEKQKQLINVFKNPEKTTADLAKVLQRAQSIVEKIDGFYTDQQMFYAAYELEFIMVHPAIETLFRLMRTQTGTNSPDVHYEGHVKHFIKYSKIYMSPSHEFSLITDMLANAWENAKDLSFQLEHINKLQGLIPICTECKKIRDDKGYWNQVDSYIKKHLEVEFSHSICPECSKKLYPEYQEDE